VLFGVHAAFPANVIFEFPLPFWDVKDWFTGDTFMQEREGNTVTLKNVYFNATAQFGFNLTRVKNNESPSNHTLNIRIESGNRVYARHTMIYEVKSIFETCSGGCSKCDGQGNCVKCYAPSKNPLLEEGKCVTECSQGYF